MRGDLDPWLTSNSAKAKKNKLNQKKKEEQKKCNSKSELVQMKIDQTNAMIERIEDSLNKLDKPEQNGVDFDLDSFKKELGSLKKKIKKKKKDSMRIHGHNLDLKEHGLFLTWQFLIEKM